MADNITLRRLLPTLYPLAAPLPPFLRPFSTLSLPFRNPFSTLSQPFRNPFSTLSQRTGRLGRLRMKFEATPKVLCPNFWGRLTYKKRERIARGFRHKSLPIQRILRCTVRMSKTIVTPKAPCYARPLRFLAARHILLYDTTLRATDELD